MIKHSKLTFIAILFCFAAFVAIADRGGFGRRAKVHFNITTLSTLRTSIPFNLKSGLTYKGSAVLSHQLVANSIFNNSIISYQKGNTIYIVPYKQKILIPSYSANTGYKLIIRPK